MKDLEEKINFIIESKEMPETIKNIARKVFDDIQTITQDNNISDERIEGFIEKNKKILEYEIEQIYQSRKSRKKDNMSFLLEVQQEETDEILISEINKNEKEKEITTKEMIKTIKDSIEDCKTVIMKMVGSEKGEVEDFEDKIATLKADIKENYTDDINKTFEQEDLEFEKIFIKEYKNIKENESNKKHKQFSDAYKYKIDPEEEEKIIEEVLLKNNEAKEIYEKSQKSSDDLTK